MQCTHIAEICVSTNVYFAEICCCYDVEGLHVAKETTQASKVWLILEAFLIRFFKITSKENMILMLSFIWPNAATLPFVLLKI